MKAVDDWYDEKMNYHLGSNTCLFEPCEHYKQIVWKEATKIGGGVALCKDLRDSNLTDALYIVVWYDEPV